ncbi:N-acetylmuramoyl-L-alanine amidase [Actinomadura rupiterrae]|uniref:N-acetylmuramoyl-L-alanine amidase n=1 Tax=Actinomadura rupiterrae TaxID=559627 RepID=UPI0020A2F80D|nr:N-acetylmuramoyl-L-alanine amidase [Actinomadura rupiterrae]MCP2337680.1 N-acetylmuramoyl-L-alanine amidase [Actinomadura rupiterrae]
MRTLSARGPVAVGLALCLGALTACGGGSSHDRTQSTADTATPPSADGGGTGVPSGEPSAAPSALAGSLRGKTVAIDPGHNGGNDKAPSEINKQVDVGNGHKECDTTGTQTAGGYTEHAFTWDVSKRLRKLLEAQGAKVVLTRKNDTGVGPCITQRAATGNKAHADAAISIHGDGAPKSGHGFHIIEPLPVPAGGNTKIVEPSARLGEAVRDAYHSGTGIPYSTYVGTKAIDKRDDLGGLNLSTVPKIFIECGNMQNPGDATKMSDPAFRQRAAAALDQGITAFLSGR